jgi:hypothetical protein
MCEAYVNSTDRASYIIGACDDPCQSAFSFVALDHSSCSHHIMPSLKLALNRWNLGPDGIGLIAGGIGRIFVLLLVIGCFALVVNRRHRLSYPSDDVKYVEEDYSMLPLTTREGTIKLQRNHLLSHFQT